MNETDTTAFTETMDTLWAGRFTERELVDWFRRLRGWKLSDVLAALDEHKNVSKFKPSVAEILARLKGRQRVDRPRTEGIAMDSTPDIYRKAGVPGDSDVEVTLRYWRAVWRRFHARIEAAAVEDARPSSIARNDARERAYRQHCTSGCVNELIGLSMPNGQPMKIADAERAVSAIFAEPDFFDIALSDVLGELPSEATQ